MTDHAHRPESSEPIESADPMARIDAAEPTDPIDSTDPIEPTDSTDPLEAMLGTESSQRYDHREPRHDVGGAGG